MSSLIRRAAAAFVVAHGVAHLVGFLGSWQLGQFRDAPYTTGILNGAVDIGDGGMRVLGILWLVAAGAFVVAAAALWRGDARPVALVTVGSLALCLLGLPNAAVGVGIDAVILVALGVLALLQPAALHPTRHATVRR